MKTVQRLASCVSVGVWVWVAPASAQESREQARIMSEPVPGAEITVEQVEPAIVIPKSTLVTNERGEFTLVFTPDQLARLPDEFTLLFTIKPKDPGKFPVESNRVVVKVKKSGGPRYSFDCVWNQPLWPVRSSGTTNKGTFAVNSKAQT